MTQWIALLRGVNVGGKNILPMAALRAALEAAGLRDVRTYIQSGNIVFRADMATAELERLIAEVIATDFGFRPRVLVFSGETLRVVLADNPFPEAEADPKTLQFFFLSRPATGADLAGIEALRAPSERIALTDLVFYLHAPDGIGRSKLAAKTESLLGVPATARNLRSVQAIAKLTGA